MRPTHLKAPVFPAALVLTTILCALTIDPAHAYLALVRQGVESAEVPNSGDLFGYTIVTGDFDGDGRDDLAVASPWEANGLINTAAHGIVTVNWGTVYGLEHVGASVLSPGTPPDDSLKFGFAMAVGDFNGDNYDDLAVGLHDNDVGTTVNAGSVWIYDGYNGGIQLAASLMIDESDVGGTPEENDNFGFTLASGDFDDNGYDDLAITSIGENGGTGRVTIVYSVGVTGLSTSTAHSYDPSQLAGSIGTPASWFGKALATGDLDRDGFDDLVIGAPYTVVDAIQDAGRVYVLYGSPVGISTTDTWDYDNSDDSGFLQETSLELGWSLAVGDFRDIDNMGPLQIVAGTPGYEYGGQNDTGGALLMSHLDAARGVGSTLNLYSQPTNLDDDDVLANDRMGESLAAGDLTGDGFDDLAIGASGNDITDQAALGPQLNSGSVYLYASDNGSSFGLDTHITHKTLNDHVFASDFLGHALAFGDFEGGGRVALAAGAPYGDYYSYEGDPTISNAGRVYIHAPWRQPRNRPHRGSAALDCDGYLIYAQRPFQRMRPASTTKTMTLKLACDFIDQGQDPAEWGVIPAWVANNVGGSQAFHVQGDMIMYFDLLKTMMTVSGNDSAMWLAAQISGEGLDSWSGWSTQSPGFAADMETQASQWNMTTATSFTNAAGIDSGDHYTTPYDFAVMSYRAIDDDCVKQIVNQPNWVVPVQRFGVGGNPGQRGLINLLYSNGFVNAVRSRNPSSVGMKGGQTPGALRTGVYNSYVALAAAHNAASGFGVWDDDDPLPGALADCNTCIGAELLAIADLYCEGAALPDEIILPEPGPDPWATLAGMSSAADDTASGLVFNAVGSEANVLGQQIQVDLLRANQVWPTAELTALLRHNSEFCLAGGETQNLGVAPYQQHDGFTITNRGGDAIDVRLQASDPLGYDQTVMIEPDSSFTIPATNGSNPAPTFQLSVTNQGTRAEACIEVQETGYRSLVSLGDGAVIPDVATFLLDRVLQADYDMWSLEFEGLDPETGNLIDVSAHDPNIVSGVGDGELPHGPRPLGSYLLPNVPNPFNPSTQIRFDLAEGGPVDLRVFDLRGRLVRTLATRTIYARGRHSIAWDGRDGNGRMAASGVYFVRMDAESATDSQRVLLLK